MRRLSGNGPPPLSVTSSANVVDSGSSRTVAASWKLTRCLLRFAAAFAGSHSNCTARVYGPVPGDHQTAERLSSAAAGAPASYGPRKPTCPRRLLQRLVRRASIPEPSPRLLGRRGVPPPPAARPFPPGCPP